MNWESASLDHRAAYLTLIAARRVAGVVSGDPTITILPQMVTDTGEQIVDVLVTIAKPALIAAWRPAQHASDVCIGHWTINDTPGLWFLAPREDLIERRMSRLRSRRLEDDVGKGRFAIAPEGIIFPLEVMDRWLRGYRLFNVGFRLTDASPGRDYAWNLEFFVESGGFIEGWSAE